MKCLPPQPYKTCLLGQTDGKGGGVLADWLWYVWIYSFLGYLLEKGFAWWTGAVRRVRKCCLLLPLCPVYGLGMAAVLALPQGARRGIWLPLLGGAVATAVEYVLHWFYDIVLGVRFWDYSALRGNLRGRICPAFALLWGVLAALAVKFVQPMVAVAVCSIPWQVTYAVLLFFVADALCAARVLWVTGDVEALGLMT